jgi:anti-sigma factor RsiW
MKCTEIEKQINSFLDEELSPSLTDKIEMHLKECHACEETFESLQTLRQILGKDISIPVWSKLDGRVMQAFARHHETKQRKDWLAVIFGQIVVPKPAFAVALLLFALFNGLAFQFGRMTAAKTQSNVPVAETAYQSSQKSEPVVFSKLIEESKNNTLKLLLSNISKCLLSKKKL